MLPLLYYIIRVKFGYHELSRDDLVIAVKSARNVFVNLKKNRRSEA